MTTPDRLSRIEELDLSNFEAEILEQLKEQAGLVWTCHGLPGTEHLPWTMTEGTNCDECGMPQP